MSSDNQFEFPQSFIALYVSAGRSTPNAPHDVVLARYEQCEDMALGLMEQAQVLVFKESLSEREILMRCHRGMLAENTHFSVPESGWVIHRLAELLEWTPLPPASPRD